jgi:glutathione S-transferase
MAWVEIVTCLALIQYLVFGSLVAKARGQYGVKAPAVTGHEMFERFYRVQMNTLELLIVFVPSVWLAARYWSPALMAGIASVYLVGRIIYLRSYTKDPASRGLGFMLSMGPTAVLLLAGLVGAAMAVTSP